MEKVPANINWFETGGEGVTTNNDLSSDHYVII